MDRFDLVVKRVGEGCDEISLLGEVTADAVPRLEAELDRAVTLNRDVLLNFGACGYLSPDALATISAASGRFLDAGLGLEAFGATGIQRQLISAALKGH